MTLPFADFFAEVLRTAGIAVSLSDYQRLALLLARWPGTEPAELASAIAALLARDEDEAERIRALFLEHCGTEAAAGEPTPAGGAAIDSRGAGAAEGRTPQQGGPTGRRSVGWALAVAFVAVLLGLGVAIWSRDKPPPPPGNQGEDTATTKPEEQEPSAKSKGRVWWKDLSGDEIAARLAKQTPTAPPLRALSRGRVALVLGVSLALGLVGGAALVLWRARRARRRQYRARLEALPGPRQYSLVLRDLRPAFSCEELDAVATVLDRLRVPCPGGRELDVPGTLRQALRGQHPPLLFRARETRRPVLVLCDISQDMEAWTRKVNCLLDGLARRGVALELRYFTGTPEQVTQRSGSPAQDLAALAAEQPEAALLVISSGAHALTTRGRRPAPWVRALSRWPRRAWLHPLGDPTLFPPGVAELPLRVWPMSPQGILGAAYSLRQESGDHLELDPRRSRRPRAVRREDIVRLSRLVRLAPPAGVELAELLRQRYLPAVPEDVILYLRAASLTHGEGPLRFEPPRQDEGRSAEEVAVLHYLRRVLREDSRPADLESAAGLRWRLDCALLDLKLPDPRGVYHPPALRELRELAAGPLAEEVSAAVARQPAVPGTEPEALFSVLRAQRVGLGDALRAWGWLRLATATALIAALVGGGALGGGWRRGLLYRTLPPAEACSGPLAQDIAQGRQALDAKNWPEALERLGRAYLQRCRQDEVRPLLVQVITRVDALVMNLALPDDGAVSDARFSSDGSLIATAGRNGLTMLWDGRTGKERRRLRGHQQPVRVVKFTPDGSRIVTGGDDKTAKLWEVSTGKELTTLAGHRAGVTDAAFSPDGARVATASDDLTAALWDARSGRRVLELTRGLNSVASVEFVNGGSLLLTTGGGKDAQLWDAKTGKVRSTLSGHQGPIRAVLISPDDSVVLTASADKTARLWDTRSGALQAKLVGHEGGLWSASLNPAGTRIATASSDRTARVWDISTRAVLRKLTGHHGSVVDVHFDPEGKYVVSASDDGTARLWDVENGEPWALFPSGGEGMKNARFSPAGDRLITVSASGRAALWDVRVSLMVATLLRGSSQDTDGDGIVDWMDKCPTEPGVPPTGCPRKVIAVTDEKINLWQKVSFASNKSTILPASFDLLDDVVAVLKERPMMKLRIEVHTDNRGTRDWNMKLSEARAASVRDYLIRAGVAPERLTSIGYGGTRPIADNSTAAGREKNIRVEFIIVEQ